MKRSSPPPQLSGGGAISALNDFPLVFPLQAGPSQGQEGRPLGKVYGGEGGGGGGGGEGRELFFQQGYSATRRFKGVVVRRQWGQWADNSALTTAQWKANKEAVRLQWRCSFAPNKFTQPRHDGGELELFPIVVAAYVWHFWQDVAHCCSDDRKGLPLEAFSLLHIVIDHERIRPWPLV